MASVRPEGRPAAADDVRASYCRFPGWTQPFWTWLTGKALPGQQPLIVHSWASYLAVTATTFLGGLALSWVALSVQPPWWGALLAVGLLSTLNGARTMILVVAHQTLHRRFSGRPAWDEVIGELVTVLNVYEDFATFKNEHFDNHHRRSVFATEADPPVRTLFWLGFRPGMTRRALWRRALVVFVSPTFYGRGIGNRLRCNLTRGSWRRVAAVAWIGFWLSVPFWVPNGYLVLLVGFVLPVLVGAQLSALLDRLGEHAWLTPPDPRHGRRFYTAAATSARFCGAPVPPRGLSAGRAFTGWLTWVGQMLGYHLPSRLMVVVGDLPNHDYHHHYPSNPDWMIAAYARQRDLDSAAPEPEYSEVWGMWTAVDRMFRSMSEAPAHATLVG